VISKLVGDFDNYALSCYPIAILFFV